MQCTFQFLHILLYTEWATKKQPAFHFARVLGYGINFCIYAMLWTWATFLWPILYNSRMSCVPHIMQLILFIFPSTQAVFNYHESNLGSFIPYQINTAADMATLHFSEMF